MTEKKIAVQQMLLVSGLLGCSVVDNQKSRHVHGQRLIVKLSNRLVDRLVERLVARVAKCSDAQVNKTLTH